LPIDWFICELAKICGHLQQRQNILIVGEGCSGKSMAVKLAAFYLRLKLVEGSNWDVSTTCDYRYVREHEIK
jgi:hypothetical protein